MGQIVINKRIALSEVPTPSEKIITVSEEAAALLSKKKVSFFESGFWYVLMPFALFQIWSRDFNGPVVSNEVMYFLEALIYFIGALFLIHCMRQNAALPLKRNILRNQGWDGIGPIPKWVLDDGKVHPDLFDPIGTPIDWNEQVRV